MESGFMTKTRGGKKKMIVKLLKSYEVYTRKLIYLVSDKKKAKKNFKSFNYTFHLFQALLPFFR